MFCPKEIFVFFLNIQCIEYTFRIYMLLHIKKHYFIHFCFYFIHFCLLLKWLKAFSVSLNINNTGEKSYSNKFGESLSFTCFNNFIKRHKQFVYQKDILASSCLWEICGNACLITKALKGLKDIKGHPAITDSREILLGFI